jgi:hypothetical protein
MEVYKIYFSSATVCPFECVGVLIDNYIQICEVIS